MPSRREELEQILDQTRAELFQLIAAEEIPGLQALLGRYFKYRNSYSSAETDADYWWVYRTPTTLTGQVLSGLSFQQDSRGEIKICADDRMPFRLSRGPGLTPYIEGYLEITPEEFWGAWAALQVQMQQAAERAGRPLGL